MEWRELLSRLRKDEHTLHYAVPTVLAALLLCVGCGFVSVCVCVGALALGYFVAEWAQRSNGEFLSPLVDRFIPRPLNAGSANASSESPRGKDVKPWKDLLIGSDVNASLEVLVEEMIEQYVNNWYGAGISHDKAFLNDIRYQVRFLASKLLLAIKKVDLAPFILEELLPSAALHVRRINDIEGAAEASSTPSTIEQRMGEKLRDVHYALRSRQHEVDYLKQVVDYVLPHVLDERRLSGRANDDDSPTHTRQLHASNRAWPSHPARHFIRELLTHSALLPLLDLLADPDTLNYLLCLLFDPTPTVNADDTSAPVAVPFLAALTESAVEDLPDSLLQLKLTDILSDARLFSMFHMYLLDTNGPVNELKFAAESKRILEQMQRKNMRDEVKFDVWQLYSRFVFEAGDEKITLNGKLVDEFRVAIEGSDDAQQDRMVEWAYQEVYARLQWEHVLPFCQSETFMGHLCGSPPAAMEELDDLLPRKESREERAAHESAEKSFSFTNFKNQLMSAIKAVPEDEEEGMGMEQMEQGETMEEEEEEMLLEELPVGSGSEQQQQQLEALPAIDVSFATHPLHPFDSPPGGEGSSCSEGGPSPHGSDAPFDALVIDPDRRDINGWRVSIPNVVAVKESSITGRWYFAYSIEVQRSDAEEHETKIWTVERKYSEFYVLESKLMEFHAGALSFATLPPKKMFVPRTREFVDQYRYTFAAFLAGLCKQTLLTRSDLLFAFLTSPAEFTQTLNLSDMNPLRMVRKVPGKLTREKGQNVKPFLLSLMAGVLADGSATCSASSVDAEEREDDSVSQVSSAPFSLYSTVFGNNLASAKLTPVDVQAMRREHVEYTNRSVLDSLLLLCLPLLSAVTSCAPSGVRSVVSRCALFLLRVCARRTFDDAVTTVLHKLLHESLRDSNLVACIQLVQRSLFCREDIAVTEQEKALRMELAERRTRQFVEDSIPLQMCRFVSRGELRHLISQCIKCLQYPCLNKQLSYVLLDKIVHKLFPIPLNEHPLQ